MVRCGMKTMAAGKFKATCLAVMDEVQAKREPVLVTKNGRPVAKLVPVDVQEDDPLTIFRFGKGRIVGDIVSPIERLEDWDEFK
jgi:prevent-host-death family protein